LDKITLREFIESVDDPIFLKNRDGAYIDCNHAFESFMGIARDKLIGSTIFEITPNAMAELHAKKDKELFEQKTMQKYAAEVPSPENEKFIIQFNKILFRAEPHQDGGMIGFIKDFSEEGLDFFDGEQCISLDSCCPILTNREIELLSHLASGLTVKQIARIALISHHTVTHHLKSIYLKLNVKNKVSALIEAKHLNLI
jgi:PAS domain S-box-containing protein